MAGKLIPHRCIQLKTAFNLIILASFLLLSGTYYKIQSGILRKSIGNYDFQTHFAMFSNSCKCQSMFTIGHCENENIEDEKIISNWKSIRQNLNQLHHGKLLAAHEVYSSLSRHLKSGYKINIDLTKSIVGNTTVTAEDAITKNTYPKESDTQLPYIPCKQHLYSPMEALKCVQRFNQIMGRELRLAFVGDSTIRGYMESFIGKFDQDFHFHYWGSQEKINVPVYQNFLKSFKTKLMVEGNGIQLGFYWAPFIERVTKKTIPSYQGAKDIIQKWIHDPPELSLPDVVLISSGMWYAFYMLPIFSFGLHYDSLSELSKLLEKLASKTTVLFHQTNPIKQWFPYKRGLSNPMDVLNFVNQIKFVKFPKTKLWIWDSMYPVALKENQECEYYYNLRKLFNFSIPAEWACSEPAHFGIRTKTAGNNLLLNLICNKLMNLGLDSCCS